MGASVDFAHSEVIEVEIFSYCQTKYSRSDAPAMSLSSVGDR